MSRMKTEMRTGLSSNKSDSHRRSTSARTITTRAQMGVHLVFFLRITTGPDNTNNVPRSPAVHSLDSCTAKASTRSNQLCTSPAAFKAAAMIGPGATRDFAPGGAVGSSGTGRPAALKDAAITVFGSSG